MEKINRAAAELARQGKGALNDHLAKLQGANGKPVAKPKAGKTPKKFRTRPTQPE